MPIVAIAGAGLALASGGVAAIGGVLAGTATLATTLTAVATVGATIGAVGAITGNQDLMTAGMVMGGIGGIGSLAANAGLFGAEATTASLFGGAADALAPVTSTPMNASMAAMMETVPMETVVSTAVAPTSSGIVDSLGGLTSIAMAPASAPDPMKISGLQEQQVKVPESPKMADAATGMINQTPASLQSPQITGEAARLQGIERVSKPVERSMLQQFGDFVRDDESGMVGYGLIQAGGSLISGMFDQLEPAQVEALKAQAEANRAAAAQEQMRLKNMGQSLPVARRVPVLAPVTGRPAPTGMINNISAAVTGVVA